jgi:hypothetical protein
MSDVQSDNWEWAAPNQKTESHKPAPTTQLIAAAPDLLASLRRAETALRNYPVWAGLADECKRAIAKATA